MKPFVFLGVFLTAVCCTRPPAIEQPLTVGEKYQFTLRRSVDAGELMRIGAGASLDQARNDPREWGRGWDSYGVRMASHLGQHLLKEQIVFAVRALDHEDPRPILSGMTGFWPRTRFAVVHTFITRNDNGQSMPAYGRFAGDYAAGFVSRLWFPDRFHTAGAGFKARTGALAVDVGMNVLREFWPEIRHGFRRR